MKFHAMCLFLFCVSFLVVAQKNPNLTQDEREMLESHAKNIETALPSLEQEFQTLFNKLSICEVELRRLRTLDAESNSLWEKSKLKVKLTYYEKQEDSLRKNVQERRMWLCIHRCLLFAFTKYQFNRETLKELQEQASPIEKFANKIDGKIQNAEKREREAQNRLEEIAKETSTVDKSIKTLKQLIRVEDDRKTWSNFQRRMELESKLKYNQANRLRLQTEAIARRTVLQDSRKEKEALHLEQKIVAVVLRVIQ